MARRSNANEARVFAAGVGEPAPRPEAEPDFARRRGAPYVRHLDSDSEARFASGARGIVRGYRAQLLHDLELEAIEWLRAAADAEIEMRGGSPRVPDVFTRLRNFPNIPGDPMAKNNLAEELIGHLRIQMQGRPAQDPEVALKFARVIEYFIAPVIKPRLDRRQDPQTLITVSEQACDAAAMFYEMAGASSDQGTDFSLVVDFELRTLRSGKLEPATRLRAGAHALTIASKPDQHHLLTERQLDEMAGTFTKLLGQVDPSRVGGRFLKELFVVAQARMPKQSMRVVAAVRDVVRHKIERLQVPTTKAEWDSRVNFSDFRGMVADIEGHPRKAVRARYHAALEAINCEKKNQVDDRVRHLVDEIESAGLEDEFTSRELGEVYALYALALHEDWRAAVACETTSNPGELKIARNVAWQKAGELFGASIAKANVGNGRNLVGTVFGESAAAEFLIENQAPRLGVENDVAAISPYTHGRVGVVVDPGHLERAATAR